MNKLPRVEILKDRAAQLRAVRSFFHERNVTEVDCPLLNHCPPLDTHIAVVPARFAGTETCYLHTSPEYGMKRLLAEGIGDIYQLSHVFRDAEVGQRHNPEFMMLEWYRVGWSLEQLQDEVADIVRLFLGDLPCERLSYRNAFLKYAGVDLRAACSADLKDVLAQNGIEGSLVDDTTTRDDLLNLIMGVVIEPHLGKDTITMIVDYPASQAELAQTRTVDGEVVAGRFECYVEGIELANGYHELLDAKEQRRRFENRNLGLIANGRDPRPIDEHFLAALELGIPECSGVAVGFDRLMMLRHGGGRIADVIPFHWPLA